MVEVNKVIAEKRPLKEINSELKKGISFLKCRKCGCMKETLETILSSLSLLKISARSVLILPSSSFRVTALQVSGVFFMTFSSRLSAGC